MSTTSTSLHSFSRYLGKPRTQRFLYQIQLLGNLKHLLLCLIFHRKDCIMDFEKHSSLYLPCPCHSFRWTGSRNGASQTETASVLGSLEAESGRGIGVYVAYRGRERSRKEKWRLWTMTCLHEVLTLVWFPRDPEAQAVHFGQRCWASIALCINYPCLHPWTSPGQNAGVGSLSLPQGIFLTQGLNMSPTLQVHSLPAEP